MRNLTVAGLATLALAQVPANTARVVFLTAEAAQLGAGAYGARPLQQRRADRECASRTRQLRIAAMPSPLSLARHTAGRHTAILRG